jgi:hypothetical protein
MGPLNPFDSLNYNKFEIAIYLSVSGPPEALFFLKEKINKPPRSPFTGRPYGKTFFDKPPFSRSFGTPSLLVRKDDYLTR